MKNIVKKYSKIVILLVIFFSYNFSVYAGLTLNSVFHGKLYLHNISNLITNGLVDNWTFNGQDFYGTTIFDRGTSIINGTMKYITSAKCDTPCTTTAMAFSGGKTPGIVGQAVYFDGENTYVDLGNTTIGGGATNFTIGAWIFPELSSGVRTIFQRRDDNPVSDRDIMFRTHNGHLNFFLNNGQTWETVSTIPLNQWHYVTATFVANTAVKLYIDGIEQSLGTTGTPPASINSNNVLTFIGVTCAQQGNNGCPYNSTDTSINEHWKGKIDELRIYNRTLSSSEVYTIYRSQAGNILIMKSLK